MRVSAHEVSLLSAAQQAAVRGGFSAGKESRRKDPGKSRDQSGGERRRDGMKETGSDRE